MKKGFPSLDVLSINKLSLVLKWPFPNASANDEAVKILKPDFNVILTPETKRKKQKEILNNLNEEQFKPLRKSLSIIFIWSFCY